MGVIKMLTLNDRQIEVLKRELKIIVLRQSPRRLDKEVVDIEDIHGFYVNYGLLELKFKRHRIKETLTECLNHSGYDRIEDWLRDCSENYLRKGKKPTTIYIYELKLL